MTVTVGSLFSGMGGFDLGFARAGLRTSWTVEIDRDARRVLARHFPGVPLYEDVRECGRHNLSPVDVVCFGFPCQDVSVAGKRAGLVGERTGLFHEAVRVVRELRPSIIVAENVPGLLSSRAGADFGTVLRELVQCGSRDLCWRVLDSRHWGVPQRRRRVFIVGDFAGERAAEILVESPCGCRHPAKGRETKPGVAPSVTPGARRASGARSGEQLAVTLRSRESSPGVNPPASGGEDDANLIAVRTSGYSGSNGLGVYQHGDAPTLDTSGNLGVAFNVIGLGQTSKNHAYETVVSGCLQHKGLNPTGNEAGTVVVYQCHGGNVGPMGTIRRGNGTAGSGVPFVTHTLRAAGVASGGAPGTGIGEDGDPVPTLADSHTPAVAFAWQQGGDTNLGMTGDGVPPVRAGQTLAVQQAMSVRRLTPVEAARLQGFPDDWLDLDPPLSDSKKYALIGNAVTVNVAHWLGRRIVAVLGGLP